ncbi:response regulator [Bacillus sp. sid0103]|uniref:response regulator transcription factor n=1 Tax=Bacillus sp. sid0103 TaxID=2856337 RepID=UPI001C455F8E|nr:response regulator [Bacillus sp. sid0103]MBV7505605.1 response regulator [Bacillus sp. sid0103]
MLKLLIADDEPKIIRGLKKSLNWDEWNIQIVGEAQDGETAFELALEVKPDILFLDINMPFLNGLQLIEKLKKKLPSSIIIVISGHDEFSYAQEALRLNVFEYLLKPVNSDDLRRTVTKAVNLLDESRRSNQFVQWLNEQLDENVDLVRNSFLCKWVKGQLNDEEIVKQLHYFRLDWEKAGIFVIKPMRLAVEGNMGDSWEMDLLLFSMQNIIDELLDAYESRVVFRDDRNHIVAIIPMEEIEPMYLLSEQVEEVIEKLTGKKIMIAKKVVEKPPTEIPNVYSNFIKELNEQSMILPVVILAKRYIEKYYYKQNLTLQEVAQEVNVSPSYLSRLLKEELGSTFIDYLTQVRIQYAIKFMENPSYKIYEVADKVGYNTQHYFSTAFKKVMGVSPSNYVKEGGHY